MGQAIVLRTQACLAGWEPDVAGMHLLATTAPTLVVVGLAESLAALEH